MGEKYGYTLKTYNLLAVALLLKNDTERAVKIFESALSDLKLDTTEGEAAHLYQGNSDLSSLLVNYIKCHYTLHGLGQGTDFFKGDQLS